MPASFVDRGLIHWLTHVEEYRWPDPPCYQHNQFEMSWFSGRGRDLSEFDFVGVTEQFDESILLLCRMFGWELPYYRRENVDNSPRPALDGSVIRRFREINAADYALHQESVAILERRKVAYGPRFAEELTHLREMLGREES